MCNSSLSLSLGAHVLYICKLFLWVYFTCVTSLSLSDSLTCVMESNSASTSSSSCCVKAPDNKSSISCKRRKCETKMLFYIPVIEVFNLYRQQANSYLEKDFKGSFSCNILYTLCINLLKCFRDITVNNNHRLHIYILCVLFWFFF